VSHAIRKTLAIDGNNLLRSLDARDLAILQTRLEEWPANAGTILHQPGDVVRVRRQHQ